MTLKQELPAKAVMARVSGRASTGPRDTLFVKFKEQWNSIKEAMPNVPLNLFDWQAVRGTPLEIVAQGVRRWAIEDKEGVAYGKGDYDNALNLILIYLGVTDEFQIPRPCNVRLKIVTTIT